MKYATFIVEIDPGHINTLDPFSLPMPTSGGKLDDQDTEGHTRRLGALKRVFDHNTLQASRPHRPLRWMLAIEFEWRSAPEIEGIWLRGEEGSMEALALFDFKFMVPTLDEGELLGYRAAHGVD